MQGSKRRRGDSWELTVSAGFDGNGKRIRHYRTLNPIGGVPLSAAEADKALRAFILELEGGLHPTRMTVSEYLDYWLEEFVKPKKKPKTYIWYETNVRVHLKPTIGNIRLVELTSHDINRALNSIAEKTNNQKDSIDGVYRTIRAALEIAVGTYVQRNVASDKAAKPPRSSRHEIISKHPVLSVEQSIKLLETAKAEWEACPCTEKRYQWFIHLNVFCALLVALQEGMRQGEILGLRDGKVNFEDMSICIDEQLNVEKAEESEDTGTNKKRETSSPKTESSNRYIPMTNLVAKWLKYLIEMREEQKEITTSIWKLEWKNTGLIFSLPDGSPLDGKSLTRWHLKRLLVKAELPEIRFHDLRGTTATMLYEMGEDPWTIAAICGHSQPETARRHYIKTGKSVKRIAPAFSRLDALFDKSTL